jgi:gluconokinase
MGVSGAGKTTIGCEIARLLNLKYEDADNLHSEQSQKKMASGQPLDDDDRMPWLEKVGNWLVDNHESGVISCSALTHQYREVIRLRVPDVQFVFLALDETIAQNRVSNRIDHYMSPTLVHSQYELLEAPNADEDVIWVDASQSVDQILNSLLNTLTGTTYQLDSQSKRPRPLRAEEVERPSI